MRTALALVLAGIAATACEGPRASIEIEAMRVSRDGGNHVVAEADLLAHDQLGGSVGTYCSQVSFPGETPVEACDADLEDGDRRTLRWVSLGTPSVGGTVAVRVRLGNVDNQRSLGAPK